MLWQRDQRRLDIYDVQNDTILITLDSPPGIFQSPAWSPVDDRWLVGQLGADHETTDLVVVTDSDVETLASGLAGPVAFSWSPDGNYVSYNYGNGPLAVVDVVTGDVMARSDTTGVFAFFWSPDSKHIAFLTLAAPPNALTTQAPAGMSGGVLAAPARQQSSIPELAWSVLDVADGAVRRYGFFTPTREMVYLIAYFDQFAQSHRVWSPDSRFIIYSENQNDMPLLSVIDVTQENIVPFVLAEGVIGVWSFN
jgi:TolB protein